MICKNMYKIAVATPYLFLNIAGYIREAGKNQSYDQNHKSISLSSAVNK